jgi:diacylglycerol kinase (ATP)
MGDLLKAEYRRFLNTCIWSIEGWNACWASEKTLRQWTIANVLSIALALYLDLTGAERALIVVAGLLILAAELINTAVETTVNYLSPDLHPLAKKAKDAGSAAVAMTAIAALMAWVLVLFG